MTIADLPPCLDLYQPDRRSYLVGIIASLEEELAQVPRHRFNAVMVADLEKALAGYRDALSRLDAAAASARQSRQPS